MRGMSAIVGIVLLSLMGVSCGGTAPVDPVGGDDDDFTLPDGDTADTAVAEGFDPVAVGFELISGIDGNGGLVNFTQNANEYPPQVLVTFAGLAYFETGDDSETCTIIGLWAPEPRATPLPVNGSEGQVNLYHSYEEPLFFEMDTNTCSNMHSKWGDMGRDLIDKFDGMAFGMGFGAQTDYLRDAWSEEVIESHGEAMFATYIAMNHPDGNGGVDFVGQDWTTGILVRWDSDTRAPEVDAQDIYVPEPITGILPGIDPLPEGYISQYAYWYEDFPLLDLDLLKD